MILDMHTVTGVGLGKRSNRFVAADQVMVHDPKAADKDVMKQSGESLYGRKLSDDLPFGDEDDEGEKILIKTDKIRVKICEQEVDEAIFKSITELQSALDAQDGMDEEYDYEEEH